MKNRLFLLIFLATSPSLYGKTVVPRAGQMGLDFVREQMHLHFLLATDRDAGVYAANGRPLATGPDVSEEHVITYQIRRARQAMRMAGLLVDYGVAVVSLQEGRVDEDAFLQSRMEALGDLRPSDVLSRAHARIASLEVALENITRFAD